MAEKEKLIEKEPFKTRTTGETSATIETVKTPAPELTAEEDKQEKKDRFQKLKDELFKTTPTEEVTFLQPSANIDTFIYQPAFSPETEVDENMNKATFADNVFFNTFLHMLNPPHAGDTDVIDPEDQKFKDLRAMYDENKTDALQQMAKEIPDMGAFEKMQFATALSVSKSITGGAAPEIQQPFEVQSEQIVGKDQYGRPIVKKLSTGEMFEQLIDNPEKATYMVSGMAADIFRDWGLAAMTGGGYKAFVAFQSFNSSVGIYNEISEQLRVNPHATKGNFFGVKPESSPAVFAVANGVVNAASGYGFPYLTKYLVGKWATEKVISKAIFHAAVNAIENSAQNFTEQSIMNTALRGKFGTNMFAVSLAGLMGFGSGYAMSRYGMKMQPEFEPKNLVQPMDVQAKDFTKSFLGDDVAAFEDNKVINKMNSIMLGENRPAKDIVGDSIISIAKDAQKTGQDPQQVLKNKLTTEGDTDFGETDLVAAGLMGTVTSGDVPSKAEGRKYGQNLTVEEIKTFNKQMFKEIKNHAKKQGLVDPTIERLTNELPLEKNTKELMNKFFRQEIKDFQNEVRAKTREVVKKDLADELRSEDPQISDQTIADNFKKIDNNVDEMWRQFVENIDKNMPADPSGKLSYIASKVDELKIGDLTRESNIADLFVKNMDKGILDVDATVKDLQTRIKEVANFKLYDGLSEKLNNILKAAGLEEKAPTSIELSGGKKYLEEGIYNKKAPGVFNLYEKYKQASVKLTPEFFAADNPWFESAQTMRMNLNRAAFSTADPNLSDALTKTYYHLATLGPNDGKIRSRLANWFDEFVEYTDALDNNKIRSYLDLLDNDLRLKKEVNFVTKDLLGHKNIAIPEEIAAKLQMTDAEILAAHKLANMNQVLNEMRLMNESKVPIDYGKLVSDLPDFHTTDAQFKGNAYHSVSWSDDGKKQLSNIFPDQFRIQDEPHVSMYKPRSYNLEMRSQSQFRIDALDETKQHFNKMASTLFHRPIRKDFENIALQMFDMGEVKKFTMENGFIDVKGLFEKHAKDNQIASRMFRVVEQHDNIVDQRLTKGKVEELSGEVFAPVINGITRSVLSSPKIAFHIMNVAQPFGTLSPYLGFKNVLKNAPKGYGTFIKHFVKNKANISRTVTDIIDGKIKSDNPKAVRYGKRLDSYVKNYMNVEQMKEHYSFKGEERAFKISFKKNKFFRDHPKLTKALETTERYLFDAMVASDFSSRAWGIGATLNYLDDVYKRYKWSPKDPNHAIKKITQMEQDLNLAGMGPIPQKELTAALHEGLNLGDMTDFENKYIFHTLDSGLFHYDVANRHKLYDAARNRSKVASLAVRFTSWGLYDIELHRRIIADAFTTRNPGALMRMLGLAGIGMGVNYALKKWCNENSDGCRAAKKFFVSRAPWWRLWESGVSKLDNPYGILGSSYAQIKKTVSKASQGKFHYPSFLPQSPIDAKDVKRMYRNIRDMVYKEGSDEDKQHIDEIGRGIFDILDNPENTEQ